MTDEKKEKPKVDRLTGGVNIHELTRPKLEHHCMYLMQKRVALEDVIFDLQNRTREMEETINNKDAELAQLRERMNNQRQIYIEAITASNDEKQTISKRVIQLESEVQGLGNYD